MYGSNLLVVDEPQVSWAASIFCWFMATLAAGVWAVVLFR